MPHLTKIATCCYCGTRAALVLKGRERHELACSGCGAPLHEMKVVPLARKAEKAPKPAAGYPHRPKPKKKTKKSSRKGKLRYFAREAFELIEDIFD
ncbi:MAG: hypothetical protein QNJ44_14675 [Rhodobacter sp.]|nr:hypothetical protein [Rhodobacter sp.]